MSLKVWYPQDIRNAILAAEQASRAALLAGNPDDQFARGYREGHKAALATIAVAFGLVQPDGWQQRDAQSLSASNNGRDYGR